MVCTRPTPLVRSRRPPDGTGRPFCEHLRSPALPGPLHRHLAAQWAFKLHTATSIQTGVPQAHLDFTQASPEALEAFLRRINVSTVAAAQEVGARYDFAATRALVDVGGGAGGMAVTLTQAYPQLHAT